MSITGRERPAVARPDLDSGGAAIRLSATPIRGEARDWDPLVERCRQARVVLIGEGSHGTHEFYANRASFTRRLIEELGFNAVAIEGDWPDAMRVDLHVRGHGGDPTAAEALGGFRRFPTWMWRNADVLDFVSWLREHNASGLGETDQVGFFGLDLYSLFTSIEAVLAYLQEVDPDAAVRARERYSCFGRFAGESQRYGHAVTMGVSEPCRREAIAQLVELRASRGEWLRHDGFQAAREFLGAEENARAIADAEEYYRSMFGDPGESWNLRDRHMADTLDHLLAHLEQTTGRGKVAVWAHNSHVGDSRATDRGARGELTLGRLARERHGSAAVLVGLTTYSGSVTAATNWDMPARRMDVRPALPSSVEALMHASGMGDLLLIGGEGAPCDRWLQATQEQRAIGVVYRPQSEYESHYLRARPGLQFDAIAHFDRTRAIEPLERTGEWIDREPPETYPSAL